METYLTGIIRPYAGRGRRPYQYYPYLRGELAKRHFHIDTTRDLITRLKNDPNLRLICGFRNVPHESSFSRAIGYLAEQHLLEGAFNALVTDVHEKTVVYHVCRDATAIAARETPKKKSKKQAEKKGNKRGRPPKNVPIPEKQPTALEKQVTQTPEQSLTELNKDCAWGCKKNSEGNLAFWKGYKLHLDVSDLGFPLTACVTGANVHDSQLAIPMEQLTEQKVTCLYSLMDAGYDARVIETFIRDRERVPIIDPNKRKNHERPSLDPAKQERYKIRTTVERTNSDLKDNYIPKAIYVKGFSKVSFVLMSAVLCLAAVKYLQYFLL